MPVIRGAQQKSLRALAQGIGALAQAARERRVRPEGLGGGTFTVTSLGADGGLFATPIINHPEVAILRVHRIRPRPVVRQGQIAVREMMYLSLSLDHRVIDGGDGGRLPVRRHSGPRSAGALDARPRASGTFGAPREVPRCPAAIRELIRRAQTAELSGQLDQALELLEEAASRALEQADSGRAASLLRHCLRLAPSRADLAQRLEGAPRDPAAPRRALDLPPMA